MHKTSILISTLLLTISCLCVDPSHAFLPSKNVKEIYIKRIHRGGSLSMKASPSHARTKREAVPRIQPLKQSSRANYIHDLPIPVEKSSTLLQKAKQKAKDKDASLILPYACTQFALTIPVLLIPIIAGDLAGTSGNTAQIVGSIVSLSTLGAGIGKVVNGFVCQSLGGRKSGMLYLLGLSAFSFMLATTNSLHGFAIAGMEFCASMMWTAMTVLFSEKYESDAARFSSGIMTLSLASTTGTLMAKFLGGLLLSQFHWRQVCLLSAFVAALGSSILFLNRNANSHIINDAANSRKVSVEIEKTSPPSISSIFASIKNVVGRKMFLAIAFAKFTLFIVRQCDKILGTYIIDVTDLPKYLAGALTSSVTLGFVGGLVSGGKVHELESAEEKKTFIGKRYALGVSSCLGLALCATKIAGAMFSPLALAAAITVTSGLLAASIGFQFYQLIPMYAPTFGKDKAVFISFCDAFGFLMLSPFWSSVGKIVDTFDNGWTLTWLGIAGFLAAGGSIMTRNLEKIMRLGDKKES